MWARVIALKWRDISAQGIALVAEWCHLTLKGRNMLLG
jgi:hypothetical protein